MAQNILPALNGIETYAIKLETILKDGDRGHGTAFLLFYAGRRWLATCRHNLESDSGNLTGVNEAASIQGLFPPVAPIDLADRAIITPRADGSIVDAVAIELRDGEFQGTPMFSGTDMIAIDGDFVPQMTFPISYQGEQTLVAVTENLRIQGFPEIDPNVPPMTVPRLSANDMPRGLPWMIAYVPGAKSGFSGGPIMTMDPSGAQLRGIHTHSYEEFFISKSVAGIAFNLKLPFGGGVPIGLLLQGIDGAAGAAEEVIDVTY